MHRAIFKDDEPFSALKLNDYRIFSTHMSKKKNLFHQYSKNLMTEMQLEHDKVFLAYHLIYR